MILFAWIIYLILSILVAWLARKLVKNFYLKKISYSFILSLLLTVWFSNPGSNEVSPIIGIFIMNIFEFPEIELQRLARPFFLLFLKLLLFDFLIFKKKVKN